MANDRLIDIAVTKILVLTTAPSAPNAPTVAELTAGKDITPILTSGTEIDFEDSEVVTELGFADGQKVEAPSLGSFKVQLNMFRLWTTGAPGTDDPSVTFTDNYPTLWVYKRVGLASSAAVAAAQKFTYFKITADRPREPAGVGGFTKMMVKGLPQGVSGRATVVA